MIHTMRRSAPWLAMLRLSLLEDRSTPSGFNTLVSRADPSLFSEAASGTTFWNAKSISADGRYVVFTSSASNVVPGQIDSNGGDDIFVYDRANNTSELIS